MVLDKQVEKSHWKVPTNKRDCTSIWILTELLLGTSGLSSKIEKVWTRKAEMRTRNTRREMCLSRQRGRRERERQIWVTLSTRSCWLYTVMLWLQPTFMCCWNSPNAGSTTAFCRSGVQKSNQERKSESTVSTATSCLSTATSCLSAAQSSNW